MFQPDRIEAIIEETVLKKLANYRPEPSDKPFHNRLLGKQRMANFSLIHSLNTNFGSTIFEKVAQAIATPFFDSVETQYPLENKLTKQARNEIASMVGELSSGMMRPNHDDEVVRLRPHCQGDDFVEKKLRNVDLLLTKNNQRFLIDLKTAKPNLSSFEKYKEDMLAWLAVCLHQSPQADTRIIIGIPYNPDAPKPYNRWTKRNMLDAENQLLVGADLWNFLGGGNDIYNQLLDCFERVGNRLRDRIDAYLARM